MIGAASEEEIQSHSYYTTSWPPQFSNVTLWEPPRTATVPTEDFVYCSSWIDDQEKIDEELAKRLYAIAMGKRNLGYLYRPKIVIRLHFLAKRPRVIFQPCWSSRRWKSTT